MAFLTNYTYAKLCQSLDVKQEITLDFFIENVYNNNQLYYIFNKFELKYLFNYKNLLQDEKYYFEEYYQVIPEKVDTKTYVFEKGGKAIYHLTESCKFINKDFIDFNIPEDLKSKGEEAIEDYRNWFKTMGYAEKFNNNVLDIPAMVFAYNSIFPNRYDLKPLNENYSLVEIKPNSNNRFIENEFNYDEFLINIENLLNTYYNVFQCKVTRILSKFDYLLKKSNTEIEEKISEVLSPEFIKNYGIDKLKDKLNSSRKIKIELMKNLIDYFKWTYKLQDKEFNNLIIEKFGIVCCGNCKKEKLQD